MNPVSLSIHNLLLRAPIEKHLMILIRYPLSALFSPIHIPIPLSLTKMPESIPLRATLRIERQRIIIHRPRLFMVDLLFKRLPAKTRHVRFIQRPIRRDPNPMDDFGGGSDGVGWCEAV